jgi:methyltransferase (TIGR00027 family)
VGRTGVPDGVGRTALGMARVRAEESRRPDRLFNDPYAQAFVDAAPGALPAGEQPAPGDPMAEVLHSAVIRTRYYDDFLLDACERGCRQVVLAGAGLDTRAFRLDWPDGLRLWEIDRPDVLAFKDRILADAGATPRCERQAVPADLRGPWPGQLAEAGFRPAEPAAWLVEGLLTYLTADEAASLLSDITELSAPGSRLACEQPAAAAPRDRRAVSPRLAPFAAMWKGGLGAGLSQWLAEQGWQVRFATRDAVAAGLGRPAPVPSHGGYLTAIRPGG